MGRKLISAMALMLFIVACSGEKLVTMERPIKAEFGQDVPESGKMSVVYLDLCGKTVSTDEVVAALSGSQMALISADAQIGGLNAGEWILANRSKWGHDVSYSVGGYLGSSSRSDAYFEKFEVPSGDYITAEAGGYSFLIGNVGDEDKEKVISGTIQGGISTSWIIILPRRTDFLNDYTFTDCFAAQNGIPDSEDVVRETYVYASQGVWTDMSYIESEPVKFTVNIEQK
jgi:hypothetical protein